MTATATRARLLDAIRTYIAEHGYSPSIRDLSEATGLSTTSVHGHLQRLAQDHQVTWRPREARTVRPL